MKREVHVHPCWGEEGNRTKNVTQNGNESKSSLFHTDRNETSAYFSPPPGRSEQDTDLILDPVSENELQLEFGPSVILKNLRAKHFDKPIIAQININFLENKFEPLLALVKDKIDILMVSETKLDETFPLNQFAIDGYSQQFRLDRDRHGGGIIIYVRDNLPCKEIKSHCLPNNVEGMFLDIKIGNTKWCLAGGITRVKKTYLISWIILAGESTRI